MAGGKLYLSEMLEELQNVVTTVKDSIHLLVESTETQVKEMQNVANELKLVSYNTSQAVESYKIVESENVMISNDEKYDFRGENQGDSTTTYTFGPLFKCFATGTIRIKADILISYTAKSGNTATFSLVIGSQTISLGSLSSGGSKTVTLDNVYSILPDDEIKFVGSWRGNQYQQPGIGKIVVEPEAFKICCDFYNPMEGGAITKM